MKIVELRAENIKRLDAVEIKPDGNMVEKSPARTGPVKLPYWISIWWALAGIEAAPTEADQVRPEEGQDHPRPW